jgi:hypothetical protein
MKNQEGLSLIGFVLVAALAAFFALIAFKAVPAVAEYFTVKKNVLAIIKSGDARNASPKDIRNAYDRRATVDDTPSVRGADLEVTKENGEAVIGFEYSRKVPLFGNVSLCFDFSYSTSPQAVDSGS